PAFTKLSQATDGKAAISQAVWRCPTKTYIDKATRVSIDNIIDVMKNQTRYRWECPIQHLIPREPDFQGWGDASLRGGGGYSLDLNFWWQLEWPPDIVARTVMGTRSKEGKLSKTDIVGINDLEYAVVIINYSAAVLAQQQAPTRIKAKQAPIFLQHVDNTSAQAWTKSASRASPASKALAHLFCGILMKSDMGINAAHVAGEKNEIADHISRTFPTATGSLSINQVPPQLSCCRRFHPGQEILSALYCALLSHQVPVPTQVQTTGHFSHVGTTSKNGAPSTI
ncbi:MAG: hypothetical protein ACRDL7_14670, partial [Gaiellaceae bacterium]